MAGMRRGNMFMRIEMFTAKAKFLSWRGNLTAVSSPSHP